MTDDERQRWQKPRVPNPPPLRNKPAEIFSVVAIAAAAAFAVYWYAPAEFTLRRDRAPEVTGSLPPTRLSSDTVTPLLDQALASEPVVLRVPLGDVVTVDPAGEPISIYSKLADAGLIRVRFCHFPGANGPGKEVCVADLTEKGKAAATSSTPSIVRESGLNFPATNRSYVQFAVAQPKVTAVGDISEGGPNEATLSYQARLESTPFASTVLNEGDLPPVVSGYATLRRIGSAWQVDAAGLERK